ncbi:uncharacterized protein ACNLHF_023259 [Anomaloglossus baeobatrachus]
MAIPSAEANKEPEAELVTVDLSSSIHCLLKTARYSTIFWSSWRKTNDKLILQKGISKESGLRSFTNLQDHGTTNFTPTKNAEKTDNNESLLGRITTAGPGMQSTSSFAAAPNCMWAKLHRSSVYILG